MNTITKIISISFLTLTLSDSVLALPQGPYLGAGVGGSMLNDLNKFSIDNDDPQRAGRVFVGYNLNNWAGIELAYAKYGDTTYLLNKSADSVSYDYKQDALALVGKAYIPLDSQGKLSAYGLMGVTYLRGSADTKFLNIDISDENAHVYAPTAGA